MKTKQCMMSIKAAFLSLFCGALLSGCYTKNEVPVVPPTPTPEPATYAVTINLLNASNNFAVASEIAVSDFQGLDQSKLKKVKDGVFTFTPANPGVYSFYVVNAKYAPSFYLLNVPKGDEGLNESSITIGLQLAEEPVADAKYVINGFVIDGKDQTSLDNVTVTYAKRGVSVPTVIKAPEGAFNLELTEAGIYDFIFTQADCEEVVLTQTIQPIAPGEVYYIAMTVPMYAKGTIDGKTYSVSGIVMNTKQEILPAGEVVYFLDGQKNTVSITNGRYDIYNLPSKEDVVLNFVVDGYKATPVTIMLSQYSAGTNVNINVYLPAVEAKQGEASNAGLIVVGEESSYEIPAPIAEADKSLAIKSQVVVPSNVAITNAAGEVIEGGIVMTTSVNTTVEGVLFADGEDALGGTNILNGSFGPSGLKFSSPIQWIAENPFGNTAFDELTLLSSVDGKTWKLAENPSVPYTSQGYVANLSHFSCYSLCVIPNERTNEISIDSSDVIYYTNPYARPVTKAKFSYEAMSGAAYTVTPEEAVTTVLGPVSPWIPQIIANAVERYVGRPSGILGYVASRTTDYTINSDQMLAVKIFYLKDSYTFTFKLHGRDCVVKVISMRTTTTASVVPADPHHTHSSGHVTDGGAGGGAGGNL
ncbi:MAG: hypothetical protein PHV49_02385 [Alistipes sp.]|nr:hypothetical protein [Alistipes sp.]